MATSAFGITELEQRRQTCSRLLIELLFAGQQRSAHPIERIVSATAVSGLFGLDSTAHRVERAVGERDHVKGIDHLGGLGQDHRVDGRVDGRHVEGAVGDAGLPGFGLVVEKPGHVKVVARGQDVDDPVMLDVGDGRGVGRCGAPRA